MRWMTLCLLVAFGCSSSSSAPEPSAPGKDSALETPEPSEPGGGRADVRAVTVSGQAGAYTFAVELSSPDTGCEQYANWWEVVRPDGTLVYRRILGHSHVDEQPFTRSGGPVEIAADDIVLVRAHMHPRGYGGKVVRGSVEVGFAELEQTSDFAAELARSQPLPDGCAF